MMKRPPSSRRAGPPGRPGVRRAPAFPVPGTLSAWLLDTTERLAAAGVASPRHDAQALAAAVLDCEWSGLWARMRQSIDPVVARKLAAAADRRVRREPLAYIVGRTEFYGIELYCTPAALVPRPETETLVDVALDLIEDVTGPVVVDIGTGTGAIAIAIADERADASVFATDCSTDALRLAAANCGAHDVDVRLLGGDLFDALPAQLRGEIDLLVSNPPYIPERLRDSVDAELRAEPVAALFAGQTGDEVLLRILAAAPAWLSPDGALVLEVGTPEQAERVHDMVSGYAERGIEQDQTERPRVVWAKR